MAEIAGNVLSTIAVLSSVDDEDPTEDEDLEEVLELIGTLYRSVAFSSMLGAFSIAEALGLISINALTSDLKDLKGIYDE
jgi:hypothetical protein